MGSSAVRSDFGASSFGSPRSPASPIALPPTSPFRSDSNEPRAFSSFGPSQFQSMSPAAERKSIDRNADNVGSRSTMLPSILLRKLPVSMSKEALTSMLLFAEDFVDAQFTGLDIAEDTGMRSAFARFRTPNAAQEAQRRLNGKMNATNDAAMIVELVPSTGSISSQASSRKSPEMHASRQLSTSASSRTSSLNGHSGRQSSRFNSTFQSMGEKIPEGSASNAFNDAPNSESFAPQSPRGGTIGDHRITGKSVINDDSADDETGYILKDPVAYAKNDQSAALNRRMSSNNQPPIGRLGNLTLNTNAANANGSHMISPTAKGFSSARMAPLQSPTSEMSPNAMSNGIPPMSPSAGYPISPQFQRHQYPPANPADQNPPCNTLYVGNLPIDTSEDELKAVFSKQRGYKRLCFRTKHNGPMCFVEFEDVSFATKALNELYGHPLHNSVKGGIRLSFSKNPLGVRTGQGSSMGMQSPLGSPNGLSGLGGSLGAPPGFTTANGPPPGLAAPPGLPGLSPPINAGNNMSGFFGQTSPPPHGGPSSHGMGRSQHSTNTASSPAGLNPIGSGFSDYMMGR